MFRFFKFAVFFLPILLTSVAQAQQITPLYHNSFEDGKIEGPLGGKTGKAGASLSVPAAGKIDLDSGSFAFWIKQEKTPAISEWNILGGLLAEGNTGYWQMLMGFDVRREDFLFNFYDAGLYSPPLHLGEYFDKWKAGDWHHLAAVWDRRQGVKVYQDGQLVASNWGKRSWAWNLFPATLFVSQPTDEVYTFSEVLSDEQIAQLARGESLTGSPVALSTSAQDRALQLEQMGWSGVNAQSLPVVENGKGQVLSFARIERTVDAKRPLATLFEGHPGGTWPHLMYGASTRGRHIDMYLAPHTGFDRIRVWVQRAFDGDFTQPENNTRIDFDAPAPGIWHRKLERPMQGQHIALERQVGRIGRVDFYNAASLPKIPTTELETYSLQKAGVFPEGETGEAWRIETPTRFQNPVLATKQAVASWKLPTPELGGFQAITEPPTVAKAYDGVLVTLVTDGLPVPTPVRIQVKEPVHGLRDWLIGDAVLQPRGAGRQTFQIMLKGRPVINMPPLQHYKYLGNSKYSDVAEPIAAVPFGVKVVAAHPVNWVMGAGGSTVAFHLTNFQKALPAATDDQVEFMREGYASLMEGHAYGHRRIQIPMRWLAKFAPTRMEFRQMYNRTDRSEKFVGIDIPEYSYQHPKNTTGAPEWAFWQMQVMKEHRRILNWYIDNAQVETGEFGGIWNDDVDHIENWYDHALCMDDSGKIKNSIRFFLNGLWNHLEEGVGKYVQDTLHYYEEGMGVLAMQTLLDYGDPTVVERTMAASSHYDKWMEERNGKWVLKSVFVGLHGPWVERDFYIAEQQSFGSYPMIPSGYMIWYNRHPGAAKYWKGWEGKLEDGSFYDSTAWRAAGKLDEARKVWAQKVVDYKSSYPWPYRAAPIAGWVDEIGANDDIRKAHGLPYKDLDPILHYWGAKDNDMHWLQYKLSGDMRWLTDDYKRTWEWFQSHDWLNSAAMPSMDRNPLPRFTLIYARMGGLATNRGALLRWPQHGISYTKGADDVAALVFENSETKLSSRFYPFTDKPHEMQLRLWRLNPGTYNVTLSNDKNDDGTPEETIWQKQMTVDRGTYLDLTLPPRQVSLLTITPIETHAMNYDRPDPAIGSRTTGFVYHDHLVVHVHNLGTKPVENVLVRVRDGKSGEIVPSGEQTIARIEAPLDLKPREQVAEFKNVDANTYGSIIVEIDPEHKIDDLNPYNNRVVLKY